MTDLFVRHRPKGTKIACTVCGSTGWPWYSKTPHPTLKDVQSWHWMYAHIQGHPYECDNCTRKFTTSQGLSNHRRAKHNVR